MADHYPITVSICVPDAAMLEDLQTVIVRHRDRLQVAITEEQGNLTRIGTDTALRRAELEALVAPIQRLAIGERATALMTAGVTVGQFQAAVIELARLKGAVSTVKNRIRHLEAMQQEVSELVPH